MLLYVHAEHHHSSTVQGVCQRSEAHKLTTDTGQQDHGCLGVWAAGFSSLLTMVPLPPAVRREQMRRLISQERNYHNRTMGTTAVSASSTAHSSTMNRTLPAPQNGAGSWTADALCYSASCSRVHHARRACMSSISPATYKACYPADDVESIS